MKKILQKENIFKIILLIYIIIQPILEFIWLNDKNLLEVFGFTVATFIRIIGVFILGVFALFTFRFDKKYILPSMYILLVIIFTIIHHFSAIKFTSLVPGNFNYSFKVEVFYIIRMLIPFFIGFLIYYSNIKRKDLDLVVIILSLLFSLIIIVTNILKIAYGSYTHEIINANIFDWFNKKHAFASFEFASKGFFNHSIISIAMISIMPYLISLFIKRRNIFYFIIIVLHSIALIMIGTKASTYSVIVVLVVMILVLIVKSIIDKKIKKNLIILFSLLIIVIFNLCLIKDSPVMIKRQGDIKIKEKTKQTEIKILSDEKEKTENKIDNTNNVLINNKEIKKEKENEIKKEKEVAEETKMETNNINKTLINNKEIKEKIFIEEFNDLKLDLNNTKKFISFFDKYYKEVRVHEHFVLNSYPYKYDPYFWYRLMIDTDILERANNRNVEKAILDRVIELSNNKKNDKLWGIGYSRTSNIFNLEQDFVYQTYSMGYIGAFILLSPYIITLLISIIFVLLKMKERFTIENIALILGLALSLVLAYFSGNTLETLGVTIILGFIVGYLLKTVKHSNLNSECKLFE